MGVIHKCWVDPNRVPKSNGYLQWYYKGEHKGRQVHRVVLEWFKGTSIPNTLVVDHLCRNKSCYNPSHLEVVTQKENVQRGNAGKFNLAKTHCPQDHPYDEKNTYINPKGERICRECVREKVKAYRRKKRNG